MAFTALIIMDGFGLTAQTEGNAIYAEGIPNIKRLTEEYPSTQLGASGMSVGLPDGQMGNSEVGHLNIGAGRIVYQELTRITKSIGDGDFFENEALTAAMDNAERKEKRQRASPHRADLGRRRAQPSGAFICAPEAGERKRRRGQDIHTLPDGWPRRTAGQRKVFH